MLLPVSSFHKPTARARTPTTPAMLATMAPVGAGAPPVKLEVDEAVSDAREAAGLDVDAGVDVDADVDAAESRESADDLTELTAADRDPSAEDNVSLAAAAALLM
jgi:hypothetical protein